jgi:hypothetical protein
MSDITQLHKDFLHFGTLHSYYKHIPIYGRQYYFYRTKGLQPKSNIISYDDNNKLYIRAYNYIDRIPYSKRDDYGYELEMQDKDTYHWHFLSDYQVETSIEKIQGKLYPVTFGPFVGGIANAYTFPLGTITNGNYGEYIASHQVLVRRNPNIHEWIKEFYPEYINSDYLDQDSEITMDIYRRENDKYWEEIKTNYLKYLPQ